MESKRTVRTYDRMAAEYCARAHHPLTREIDRFVALIETAGCVLDVGCGPGQYARALGARGLRVVAADLSAGMLGQARAMVTPRLVQSDMRHLPFREAAFDGCFVCASLFHVPRVEAPLALAAFRRVLRPGGVLYVALKEGHGEGWVDADTAKARFFVYYQPHQVDALLTTSGFVVVDGWTSPPGSGQRTSWINRFARNPSSEE
jgi:ubiquinone/menaquinone biosynthesis C-methylase UbiE